jgi:hypothetical protein
MLVSPVGKQLLLFFNPSHGSVLEDVIVLVRVIVRLYLLSILLLTFIGMSGDFLTRLY